MWSVTTFGLCCTSCNNVWKIDSSTTAFATILGIAGGIYIYQPIFEQYSKNQKELKEKMKLAQESEEK